MHVKTKQLALPFSISSNRHGCLAGENSIYIITVGTILVLILGVPIIVGGFRSLFAAYGNYTMIILLPPLQYAQNLPHLLFSFSPSSSIRFEGLSLLRVVGGSSSESVPREFEG